MNRAVALVMKIAAVSCVMLAGSEGGAAPLSDKDVAAISDQASADLLKIYPIPELAARYAQALSEKAKSGAYQNLEDCAFAKKITEDLRAVHPDGHLAILCAADLQQFSQRWLQPAPANNWSPAFESVELDHDYPVATIRSTSGWPLNDQTFEQAAQVMGLAAHARYVVLDLRNNPGGHGEIGYFLASYFFPAGQESILLERGVFRDPTQLRQAYTLPYVPGVRLADAKLYILVNHGTASAAEGFAFFMQHLKRAIVIGQSTAGSGNPATMMQLPAGLGLMLPYKRVLASDSDEGWDGTGVLPDVPTNSGAERDTAYRLIREDMAKTPPRK